MISLLAADFTDEEQTIISGKYEERKHVIQTKINTATARTAVKEEDKRVTDL